MGQRLSRAKAKIRLAGIGFEVPERSALRERLQSVLANGCDGVGRFQLEAAVQSAHAVRRHRGRADWPAIEQLYDALCELTGSPVAALNRAVAQAESRGPGVGLAALDRLAGDARLADYQPYWAARADLLARCGKTDAAAQAYQRAIGLERDPAVRRFLQQRAAAAAAGNAALPGGIQ